MQNKDNKCKREHTENNCWNKKNQCLDKTNFRNIHKDKIRKHDQGWTSSKERDRPDDSAHVRKYYRTEHPAIFSLLVAMASKYNGVFKLVSIVTNTKQLATIIISLFLLQSFIHHYLPLAADKGEGWFS